MCFIVVIISCGVADQRFFQIQMQAVVKLPLYLDLIILMSEYVDPHTTVQPKMLSVTFSYATTVFTTQQSQTVHSQQWIWEEYITAGSSLLSSETHMSI